MGHDLDIAEYLDDNGMDIHGFFENNYTIFLLSNCHKRKSVSLSNYSMPSTAIYIYKSGDEHVISGDLCDRNI